jgi:nucleotide-binding universal stress UspA family protein
MTKHILVATDLSPASDAALSQAAELARSTGAKVTVCHVAPNIVATNMLFPQFSGQAALGGLEIEERAREAVLDKIKSIPGWEGKVTVVVAMGEAASEIARASESAGADLVIVGSHGRTGLARTLVGSVAERVVRSVHCPVLVARESPASGPVLAATDLSPPAQEAVIAAAAMAKARGAELACIHALDMPIDTVGYGYLAPFGVFSMPPDPAGRESLRDAAQATLKAALELAHVKATAMVHEGRPAPEIVRAATDLGASLVVVATNGRTGLARIALGSVAESVVRHAPCSVLAVRTSGTAA